jgi:hypothetical protein
MIGELQNRAFQRCERRLRSHMIGQRYQLRGKNAVGNSMFSRRQSAKNRMVGDRITRSAAMTD